MNNINDKVDNNNFGLLMFKQSVLNKIFLDSGELAKNNEWQFHYTALVGSTTIENQTISVAIPLVCYNYKQEVSGAHIKFHLSDVEEVSDACLDIAKMKAKEFLATNTKDKLYKLFGNLEWKIVPLMSCHKHPSKNEYGSDGFSSTDLRRNIDNPGVVFPYSNVDREIATFASIMHCGGKRARIAHTEMRMVSQDNDSINYKRGVALTVVAGYSTTLTSLEDMFGIEQNIDINYSVHSLNGEVNFNEDDLLSDYDFEPAVFIDSSNIIPSVDTLSSKGLSNKAKYGSLFSPEELAPSKKWSSNIDEDMFDMEESYFQEWTIEQILKLNVEDYYDVISDIKMELDDYYDMDVCSMLSDEQILQMATESDMIKV